MLYRELLAGELNKQSDEFKRFALDQSKDLNEYLEKLARFCRTPYAEISALLEGAENCGAIPSEEFARGGQPFSISFNQTWQNHEQARAWAFEVLQNRTTFAADGSQLFAEREVSLPVAAIQIGWFENPHNEGAGYEKQARFFVIPPGELLSQDEPVIPETKVGQRRFEAEIEKIKEFLKKKQGWQQRGERMPLAFYDGTLLLSISLPKTDLQEGFINKLVELVRASELAEVPLVGYVDRSYARDLLSLLNTFDGSAAAESSNAGRCFRASRFDRRNRADSAKLGRPHDFLLFAAARFERFYRARKPENPLSASPICKRLPTALRRGLTFRRGFTKKVFWTKF